MADIEASTADLTTLDDGGHFVVVSDAGAAVPLRLPVADVQAAAGLAGTALQPGSVGTAAFADVSYFATAEDVGDIAAALAAILAGGD